MRIERIKFTLETMTEKFILNRVQRPAKYDITTVQFFSTIHMVELNSHPELELFCFLAGIDWHYFLDFLFDFLRKSRNLTGFFQRIYLIY